MKDRLYLLRPDFVDKGRTYFCPGCAQVEGMLSFYPELREQIEVLYIDFPRPRPRLVAEIGEANQGCPKLVLAGEHESPDRVTVGETAGRRFISAPLDICRYLARAYEVGEPH